ncbi:MAG: nitrilase-related carbon-nitrogen hydrolase [Pseudomonadota bacterium]
MDPIKHSVTGIINQTIRCLIALSLALPGMANSQESAPATLVAKDGTYPTVPLIKESIVVKVVQNGVRNLEDYPTVAEGLAANLSIMSDWVEQACSEGPSPDFVLFNEFPLTGYSTKNRKEKLEFTLQIPGPETEHLGKLAKDCDTYLIFGSYARDEQWPGHILSINTVIGRDGAIAKKFWKTRNVKRLGNTGEIPTTTIESVRDRYRELYGIDEEFPVLRTEYGNIAVSTVQLDPFVFAAFAMRGTEILFRTATVFSKEDVLASARFHNVYSAMSNITFPEGSNYESWGGRSLIVSPKGEVLAEQPDNSETIIAAEIPIAEFRENRRLPRYPLEVVAPVFEQYVDEIPLNHMDMPADAMPKDRAEMKDLLDRRSRWLN